MKFTGNPEFKRLLDEKKQDIVQRTSDGVQETAQFQRLRSLLSETRRKNAERDYRLVIISKADVASLCTDAEIKIAELFKNASFLTNRTVYVDADLSILNFNNDPFPAENNEARRFFASLSNTKDAWVVFHVSPNSTINYFIDGKDYGDGVFYTLDAQNSYEERKTIESLQEVLDDYRINLTHQDTYLKFFVTKAGLCALHSLTKSTENIDTFVANNKHVLNNKPEYLFQNDIRNYIQQHMRVVVSREVMLEDLDRLDIELTDEDGKDLYFIEIKWLGESINAQGNDVSTKYNATPRIKPDAVKQVVGYINELLIEKKNIKIGYLAVFDARKDDLPDSGTGISEEDLPENLREHYPRFIKLQDFRVKNENPR